MTAEDLRSLDLLVLFDDHHETFSTHTIPEATGMTRITLNIFDVTPLRAIILAAVLSLVFTPLAAQEIIVTPLDEQETSCLSHVPLLSGSDEPRTLSYQMQLIGPIGADVRHCRLAHVGSRSTQSRACRYAQVHRFIS